jgi:hypothetical protein
MSILEIPHRVDLAIGNGTLYDTISPLIVKPLFLGFLMSPFIPLGNHKHSQWNTIADLISAHRSQRRNRVLRVDFLLSGCK